MVRRISHRGPDDFGLWMSGQRECALGHARLSIIDLSVLGHQPMLDPETGNCIVFNGEIYNFRALRQECERAGQRFRSYSDTEVILSLYGLYGVECLGRLRGMFAFAIWDAGRRRLFIARDRVGKKPLNYAVLPDGIAFCSEIDSLSRLPPISRDTDPEALEFFLQLQYIPAPWSIYQGIRKLPSAHFVLVDTSGISIHRYWSVDYRHKVALSEQEALDALDEKLTESVRLRMIADVPIGALLSGGVDSSLVVAMMAKLSGDPIRTFSIGFSDDAFNELPFAQQAADICGTRHHPQIIQGDVAGLLPRLAAHYGEPFADPSAVPSFFVSQAARAQVTVVLNGDGGDELLGGYGRYCLSRAELLASGLVPDLLSARALCALAWRLAGVTPLRGRILRKLLSRYAWPEMQSLLMYAAFWNEAGRDRILGRAGGSDLLTDWCAGRIGEARRQADNAIERMLWLDNRTYLDGDLMVKMDIASMHCGLEARSPLLDHEVIEYCASLPMSLKVRNGTGKYLLKKLAERYFPADFVHRPKQGFGIPLADWLRGPLAETLRDVVRDPETLWPLDTGVANRCLDDFLHRGVDHSHRLWALLMFGVWRRHSLRAD